MATKYECPSCGATMSLAAAVSSVKCPVCRVDMSAVGEVEAAKPASPAPVSIAPSAVPTLSAPAPVAVPAGIKIAQAVTEHPKHSAMSTPAVSNASVEAAAQKLMASARSEADKVIKEAETQRAEILAHAEEHAREQVEAFFEKARVEAAETENRAKAEAEKILAAAKQDAGKVTEEAMEKAREEAAAQLAEERKKLADLQTETEKKSQELSAKLVEAEKAQTAKSGAEAAGEPGSVETAEKGVDEASASKKIVSEKDIAALTKDAVENAIREDREKHAKKDLQSRKTEANNYAKREARFIFAGSVFGALVLAYCAFILLHNPSSTLKLMTFTMMGLDGLVFLGLVGIISAHYKFGNEVIKKQKQAQREKKAARPAAPAMVKTPPLKRTVSTGAVKTEPEVQPADIAPAELAGTSSDGADSEAPAPLTPASVADKIVEKEVEPKKGSLKMKIKAGQFPVSKSKKPANEALRKAAMRAAAKRAAGKK